MPGIRVTGTFKRGQNNLSAFAITKSDALLIPIQIATDIAARDSMVEYLRMSYMLCYVISEDKTYRLGGDTTIAGQVWTLESGDFIPVTDKGVANGVVPLDANNKINPIYLDTLNLSSTYVDPDIAAMLARTTYKGNLVIVQDASADPDVASGSATYAKINDNGTSTLADFLRVEFGASVASVNSETGAVIVDMQSVLSQVGSQAYFDNEVSTNLTVLQHAGDIQTNQTDILALQTDKADLSDVLTKGNQTPYTPIDDYNPSTKKYVDDTLTSSVKDPGGEEGSIQVNESNLFHGYANFKYTADKLYVPTVVLTADPAIDNTITSVLARAADGTVKRIEVTSLGTGSSGHVILDEGIATSNRKNLNFVGTLVDISDDVANDKTDVTIRNPEWGEINGDINNQTDINDKLNSKAEQVDLVAHTDLVDEHIDWSSSGPETVALDRLPASSTADAYHKHEQQQTLATWTIPHPLGKNPSVSTVNADNIEIIGDVEYIDLNTVRVTFKVAAKGTAYLN